MPQDFGLALTVNSVNMSSKTMLVCQNNLSIKKMNVYNVAVPETSKIIIFHQGCKSRSHKKIHNLLLFT